MLSSFDVGILRQMGAQDEQPDVRGVARQLGLSPGLVERSQRRVKEAAHRLGLPSEALAPRRQTRRAQRVTQSALPDSISTTDAQPHKAMTECPWKPECRQTLGVWSDSVAGTLYRCALGHESVVAHNPLRLVRQG